VADWPAAAFLLGVYGLQAFGQYYIQDALQLADAPRQAGNLLAIIGVGTIVLVLAEAFWRTGLVQSGSSSWRVPSGIRNATDVLHDGSPRLYLSGTIVGAGIGLFLTSNWGSGKPDRTLGSGGTVPGLTNLATAGAAGARQA